MNGIKPHTHEDRERALIELVPLIKKKFGKNLRGIAARGSYARNTDGIYSDLELFAFLKEMPHRQKRLPYGKMRKTRDGLLVELIWITKEVYIQEVREVTASWYGIGTDTLLPVLNPALIRSIQSHKPTDLKRKTLEQAAALWDDIQYTSADVLYIAKRRDYERIALATFRMFEVMLNFLAFINQDPYTTYLQKVKESRSFSEKPKDFPKLTKLILNGEFRKYKEIEKVVRTVVQDMGRYLEKQGLEIQWHVGERKIPSVDLFGMRNRETRFEDAAFVWDKVQESTTKVLNAARERNHQGMALVINDMFFQYLKVLSNLNGKTLRFAKIIHDAKALKYKPRGFARLIQVVENGDYRKFSEIQKATTSSFTELEHQLEEKGFVLYQDDIDPNLP